MLQINTITKSLALLALVAFPNFLPAASFRRVLPSIAKIGSAALSTGFYKTHRTAKPTGEEKASQTTWHPRIGYQVIKQAPPLPQQPATIILTIDEVRKIISSTDLLDNTDLIRLLTSKALTPEQLVTTFENELHCYIAEISYSYPLVATDIQRMYSARMRIVTLRRFAAGQDELFTTQLEKAIQERYGSCD